LKFEPCAVWSECLSGRFKEKDSESNMDSEPDPRFGTYSSGFCPVGSFGRGMAQDSPTKKGSDHSHGNMIEARLSVLVLPYLSAVSRRAITPQGYCRACLRLMQFNDEMQFPPKSGSVPDENNPALQGSSTTVWNTPIQRTAVNQSR
jgi:hypothetical protein